MVMQLDAEEQRLLSGAGGEGVALAMRILTQAAHALGARCLIPISSAHIDGCLYHGDSGTLFAERLVSLQCRVRVPTTLNVGALDLLHGGRVRLSPESQVMARRLMDAYVAMGAKPTWTCAPYQAGHRPAFGEHVAWGESNAVAFCNSVLGARTNRYGDFLDICAAVTGRAPNTGFHLSENRQAKILIDVSGLAGDFRSDDTAYPVLGAWLGRTVGQEVAAIEGIEHPTEDQLKALGAAAASSGSVGLFHVIGVTPEAPTRESVFGLIGPQRVIRLDRTTFDATRSSLSTSRATVGDPIDAVAIGSPHLSADELQRLDRYLGERQCTKPVYACTGRHTLAALQSQDLVDRLTRRGVVIIADTCIVVTPILPKRSGVLVTNSGKFAHYTPTNTGYEVVFASLADCIESAVAGSLRLSGGVAGHGS